MSDPVPIPLEDYITFQAAAQLVPGKPNRATLFRWASKGVRGIRLRSLRVGGKIFTTAAWVQEFLAACSEPAAVPAEPVPVQRRPSDAARARRIAEAKAELAYKPPKKSK